MGARQVAAVFICGLLLLALVPVARAQSVDETRQARDSADRLVSGAIANRDAVEAELLAAMERYHALSDQLADVSSSLDSLRERIARTTLELRSVSADAEDRAVAAYMQAVGFSSAVVLGSRDLEGAIVAQRSFALISGEDQFQINTLSVTERDLRFLEEQYLTEMFQVQALQIEVDAQADHLEQLFASADAEVAAAINAARLADVAYREALDEVARARAIEAERQKREERAATTTTTPPATSTTATTAPPSSATTTTTAPAGDRVFRPSVERWRSLVANYFPANMVDQALAVMDCESRGNPEAYNPYSGASGLFQFLPGTWSVISPKAGFGGASVFEPEPNVGSAWWLVNYYMNQGKHPWTAWSCKP